MIICLGAAGTAGAVNVRAYGATGNGVTDDTTAIQRAINAGGVTVFPIGRYVHTGLTLRSGSALVGLGMGGYVADWNGQVAVPASQRSTLVLKAGAGVDSITIPAGASNGLIDGLEIDGNKAAQTGTGAGIRLADAASSEESQWKFNRVYVHDTRQHGLYIGTNRQGTQTLQSVFFRNGADDSTLGSGIMVRGSDSTVDTCLIGIAWGDSIVIAADVTRIVNTETFSNSPTAAAAGNGITISDGVSRTVISGCTIDRSPGHGLYMGFDPVNNTVANCIFHSNSQQANTSYFHVIIKAGGGGVYNNLLIGNQFARNAAGVGGNKPNYAVWVDSGATVYGKGLNVFDAGSYATAAVNDGTRYVVPTP